MENQNKVIIAKASFVRHSPRKLRLVANAVRALAPERAVQVLKTLPQKPSLTLMKVFSQAIANAKNNFKLSPGDLFIKKLEINEGAKGARKADVHAHGARFDRGIRRKKTSHIYLELSTKEGNPASVKTIAGK
jgi:large subunit ribosomal protein L22